MLPWPPSLFLQHPLVPWTFDASSMALNESEVDALQWREVFDDLKTLESGGIANPDEGRAVGHFWLRSPKLAPSPEITEKITNTIANVRVFASEVLKGTITTPGGDAFTDVLHIGIGGSQLGPAFVNDALQQGRGLPVHFFDNTDPEGIARLLNGLGERLKTTLILVVTKSGGTPEPMNALALTERRLTRMGLELPGQAVAITLENSALAERATADEWLRIFPLWDWVGGRYSLTSAVGLLPSALAGLDILALLNGAAEMDLWTRTPQWRNNPAALLAACWYLPGGGVGDRNVVVLPYADRLVLFSRYLQQLVMESLGKKLNRDGEVVHQGLTVYGNKGSTDQHAYVQQLRDGRNDFMACFLQVLSTTPDDPELRDGHSAGDYLQGFLLGTRRALHDSGRPSILLTVPTLDARALGALIAVFERAVSFYGTLIDVNAYHQPGVEAGKLAATQILDLSTRLRAQLVEGPQTIVELANALSAPPTDVYYVAEHLVLTGRAMRDGKGQAARWYAADA